MTKSPFLFDSYALLLLLQKEKGFEKVVDLLGEIHQFGIPKYLNAINLGEIIYITKREYGELKKIEALASITRLNFNILPIPNTLIFQAAEYKAQYPLSYADCFALSSAIEHKAVLVTGDPEFKKVEHLVKEDCFGSADSGCVPLS